MTDENEQDKPDLGQHEPAEIPPPQHQFVPMPPPAEEPRTTEVARPLTVTISFWIWIVDSVLSVLSGIYTVVNKNTLLADVRKNPPAGVKPDQIESLVNVSVATTAIVAFVFAALFVFLAYKIRAGRTWARTVLTVLTVLSVLFNLFFGATASTYISVIVALVAVGLLYAPNARDFFAAGRSRR